MSTLLNIGIKQQDGSYKNYTLSLNDETNGYGQNVSVWESQTKEQQAAKEQRNFVGNGKVVWTDGNVKVADKVVTNTDHNSARNIKVNGAEVVADLPF
jgi:UDP-N-acetyl-D-mannosaminuronate dehydrogenase